jgi:hypothetical protein
VWSVHGEHRGRTSRAARALEGDAVPRTVRGTGSSQEDPSTLRLVFTAFLFLATIKPTLYVALPRGHLTHESDGSIRALRLMSGFRSSLLNTSRLLSSQATYVTLEHGIVL